MRSFGASTTSTLAIFFVAAFGFQADAQSGRRAQPDVQYFTLNLPAGSSLISAPMATGLRVAVNQFLGLPQGATFFAWNPHTQQWVPGDQAPVTIGAGYLVNLPTPATLTVAGQPYSYLTSVDDNVAPGWHLFGVPFGEGVGWNDFHLYISGYPISLTDAIAHGWIDGQVWTMQGSKVQYLKTGDALLPGVAYWIHTLAPLELRAEHQGTTAATGSNQLSAQSNPNVVPDSASEQPPLSTSPQATSAASAPASTTSTMGWLGAISSCLAELAHSGAAFAEGNWQAGTMYVTAGVFGLVEYGLDGSDNSTDELTSIDSQLATLVSDTQNLSTQVTNVEALIVNFNESAAAQNDLGQPMKDASSWLSTYFTEPTNSKSREWARWAMAGCPWWDSAEGCPPSGSTYAVTPASLSNFQQVYMQAPGTLQSNYADFPFWWANQVTGVGLNQWIADGNTVDQIETNIWTGLTVPDPTNNNLTGLQAYMQYVFGLSGCERPVYRSTAQRYAANRGM